MAGVRTPTPLEGFLAFYSFVYPASACYFDFVFFVLDGLGKPELDAYNRQQVCTGSVQGSA
jgi:hypothetical protein